jgi:hypothetical protein
LSLMLLSPNSPTAVLFTHVSFPLSSSRIIRNQWSSYWGYNGYIYVAMGENTCGVLNDMTQVYL